MKSTTTAIAILVACCGARAIAGDIELVTVTPDRTGIQFVHECGSLEKDWIFEVNGSGVALFDFDSDGDLDIYFVNGGSRSWSESGPLSDPRSIPTNALYRNDGDWRFTDVSRQSGTDGAGWGCGAAVADVDNDGHLDLYVTNWGPNVLYRNRGDGTFDRSPRGVEDRAMSTSASFADFDRDGYVDLYVANYVDLHPGRDSDRSRRSGRCVYKGEAIFCGPGGLRPAPDRVYRNLGEGRFEDVTERWGFSAVTPSFGLGTLVIDVGTDGWPDVLVANDTMANFCFVNERGRRFRDGGLFLGLAYNDYGVEQGSMGLAAGTPRRFDREDIFVTNFEDDTNTLYLAESGTNYVEGTFPARLGAASYRYLGWGTLFCDFDGDGDEDLFVANGHVAPQADAMRGSPGYRQRNQLFLNEDEGRSFREISEGVAALALEASSRGAATGDLDGDGDPDIVVSNMDAPPQIIENRSPPAARITFGLLSSGASNRAAIGARVIIEAGDRRQSRVLRSGSSYASQPELVARFGLGRPSSAPPLTRVTVEWPSGRIEDFSAPSRRSLALPGRVRLAEGTGSRTRDR